MSRGPELSRDQILLNSPVPVIGSTAATMVCSPGVDASFSADEQPGTSTIRRKGSLVPALPITTQTTRLISQQSRSGMDDVEGSRLTDSNHQTIYGLRSPELPPPPTSANTTVADSRIPLPPPLANQPAENGTGRNPVRAPAASGHRQQTGAATLPRDLHSQPTSVTTTTAVGTRLPTTSPDNGATWHGSKAAAAPSHRQTATSTQGTPTRTANTRSADTAGHASPARPKPAPPKRSETTKLSTTDPRQTKAFIMNLDRVISQKNCKGSGGLESLPVPLPPRPAYVDGPTYLDTDDLPPPPAELLEGLRSMRRQDIPLPSIPAPGRR